MACCRTVIRLTEGGRCGSPSLPLATGASECREFRPTGGSGYRAGARERPVFPAMRRQDERPDNVTNLRNAHSCSERLRAVVRTRRSSGWLSLT